MGIQPKNINTIITLIVEAYTSQTTYRGQVVVALNMMSCIL